MPALPQVRVQTYGLLSCFPWLCTCTYHLDWCTSQLIGSPPSALPPPSSMSHVAPEDR